MIIILIFLMLIFIGVACFYIYKRSKKNSSILSFKDSLDLTDLPVVTFYSGHKKLNMLLDTGSSECIINKSYLETICFQETNTKKEVFGMEGNIVTNPVVFTTISYSGLKFDVELIAMDMNQAFDAIKKESGVTIHGILGSNFFTRYKYILDFDKLMFYKK